MATSRRAPARKPAKLLKAYDAKRDFKKTAEPSSAAAVRKRSAKPIFVIQEHHASRLHWDFRLEADGVLKSWAVPKEPSLDPAVKRLAVQVEDHPLAYANFKGKIPQGEYGGGTVYLWDRGTYDNLMADKPEPMTLTESIDAGHVEVELHGGKLSGAFNLVRIKNRRASDSKPNWLLIKANDASARSSRGLQPAGPSARPSAQKKTTGRKTNQHAKARGPAKPDAPVARATKDVLIPSPKSFEFTNEDKIWFPEANVTKGHVIQYYEAVAPLLLPHLRDRPMTLERLPDGVRDGGPRFWQKNMPAYYPDWVPRFQLPTGRGKPVAYTLVNDVDALLYLVNQGTLTFHPFLSRTRQLDCPDFVLFDLDPGDAPFASAVRIARQLHARLDADRVPNFVKTSGKSGLHVMSPWTGGGDYAAARAWAEGVAADVVEALPKLATTARLKAARKGRVYVDVVQNALGHHAVPPYVIRATPTATVSTPLDWDEVTPTLDPKQFDLPRVLPRLRKLKGDPLIALTGLVPVRASA
ncbi:MAG TPA: non-homologous end-joining DNA ligase [Tepidisphaeraceae bacterium]|nr:non-homologous end-joining DNA ligase [Tepidisphaeraceae bacterium]